MNNVLWSVNEELFEVITSPVDEETGSFFSDTTGAKMRMTIRLKRELSNDDFIQVGNIVSSLAVNVGHFKTLGNIIGEVSTPSGKNSGMVLVPNNIGTIRLSERGLKAGTAVARIDFYELNSLAF